MVIELDWCGPFLMVPQSETDLPCVFDGDRCTGTGLYLLTVQCDLDLGYRVNYVGETGRSLRDRFKAHRDESYEGKEGRAAEPEKFRRGIREIHEFAPSEFVADDKWSSWIDDNYRSYRVFVATGREHKEFRDRELRRYVEAAIVRTLFDADRSIKAFLYWAKDGEIPKKYRYKYRHEKFSDIRLRTPLSVQFPTSPSFHGLMGRRIDC